MHKEFVQYFFDINFHLIELNEKNIWLPENFNTCIYDLIPIVFQNNLWNFTTCATPRNST